MFKKAADATSAGLTPIRNKEIKILKEAAAVQWAGSAGQSLAERSAMLDKVFPGKGVKSMKLAGKYVAYVDADDELPMVIDLDPKAGLGKSLLMPTVLALWRAPELLPQLLIPAHVSRFVLKGADLMWPGVYTNVPKLAAGALVAIRVVGNPAPIAVGTLIVSTDEAAESGFRGAAVSVQHMYRDGLWEVAGRKLPNEGFLQAEVHASADGADEVSKYPALPGAAMPDEDEAAGGAAVGGAGAASAAGGDAGDDAAAADGSAGAAAGEKFWVSWTPDEALRAVFLQALKRRVKERDLPMLAAQLYGAVMQGCRPEGCNIDAKATSWKKFSVFLAAMEEEGIVTLSHEAGAAGDDVAVATVDREHDAIKSFRTWPSAIEHATHAAAAAAAGLGSGGISSAAVAALAGIIGAVGGPGSSVEDYSPPLFLPLFAPPPAAYPIFRTVMRPSRKAGRAAGAGAGGAGAAGGEPAAAGAPPVWSPTTGFKVDAVKSADPKVVETLARVALSTSAGKAAAGTGAAAAAGAGAGASEDLHDIHKHLDVEGRVFTQSDVVEALRAYIAEQNLAHPTDKTRINLDVAVGDALTGDPKRDLRHDDLLFGGEGGAAAGGAGAGGADSGDEEEGEEDDDEDDEEEEEDEEGEDEASMTRIDVAKIWMKRMSPFNVIIFPNVAAGALAGATGGAAAAAAASYLAGDVQLVRGPLPKITINKRALQGGRKHMTYISGLSSYRIDEAAFAKECAKRCSSSSSVTSATEAGISAVGDARARNVVQVQGDEAEAVEKLLTDKAGYALPIAALHTADSKGDGDDEDDGGAGGKAGRGGKGGRGGKDKERDRAKTKKGKAAGGEEGGAGKGKKGKGTNKDRF